MTTGGIAVSIAIFQFQDDSNCAREESFLPAYHASFSAMDAGMILCAERDQVLIGIIAGAAAELVVVNLQIRQSAT
jgi:hypothetical protein